MRTWIAGLVGLAVLAVFVAIGADDGSTDEVDLVDTAVITSYDAEFTVGEDGALTALETLQVDFGDHRKHGIFRTFDPVDPRQSGNRLTPEDVTVTRDGEPEDLLEQHQGRFVIERIGQECCTIDGLHTYEIGYRIERALSPGIGRSPTDLYWNVIPGGWTMPIEKARLTVHLPAPSSDLQCAVGRGATGGCTAQGAGTDTITVTTGRLEPQTPVTLRAGMDLPLPEYDLPHPWSITAQSVLGPDVAQLALVLLLAGAAGGAGLWLTLRRNDREPPFPLMYAPPEGLSIGEATYLLEEEVPLRAFVGTLMQAAEAGAITMTNDAERLVITPGELDPADAGLDLISRKSVHDLDLQAHRDLVLGGDQPDQKKERKAARRMYTARERFVQRVVTASRERVRPTPRVGLVVLVAVCWVGALVLSAVNPQGMAVLGLVPGLFAAGAVGVLLPGAGTVRTREARQLWSQVGGFRRVLSTDSADARLDFAADRNLYLTYLPWAVAFGCADRWTAKYETTVGAPPPTPLYAGAADDGAQFRVDDWVRSTESSMGSAIAAGAPVPVSSGSSYSGSSGSSFSSSSSGGFSGGGGGGGGGGGSW